MSATLRNLSCCISERIVKHACTWKKVTDTHRCTTTLSGLPEGSGYRKSHHKLKLLTVLHRADIFQLAAYKGHPPHLKAKSTGRRLCVAVLAAEILAATSALLTLSAGTLRKQYHGLKVGPLAACRSLSAKGNGRRLASRLSTVCLVIAAAHCCFFNEDLMARLWCKNELVCLYHR